MKFIADMHIHSRFSRATSKELTLPQLSFWGQVKGLQILGTGDCIHPKWLKELKSHLEPAEEGLFRLKDEGDGLAQKQLPPACRGKLRFMLTSEISNIYKKNDRVRKIHNVVFLPHFEAADRLQARLNAIGNIHSDGRPILGMDAKDLLEIVLETDRSSFLVPAHIWTPWFSLLGSKSGFNRIEDCFEDLTGHVFALETGLSSDPEMNWRLSQLDRYVLISCSDAHSPQKLGREATVFDTDFSYPGIYQALSGEDHQGLLGTVEFFPEEGKYHYDGHRQCRMRMSPEDTIRHKGLCPKCGQPVTVGVMARVEELADHPAGRQSPQGRPFTSLIPLPEIIAEAKGAGPNTKGVQEIFFRMLGKIGNEMSILTESPIELIAQTAGPLVAEGIRRVRHKEVQIHAGYDGEYGTIRLFSDAERKADTTQMSLF